MEELLAKLITIVGAVVLVVVGIAGLSLLLSLPLMWAWNYVVPYLFGLKTITWLQSWCLSFVAGTLLKSNVTQTKG